MTLNELKTTQYLTDLVLAIEDNNLDKTKELVNKINEIDVLSADFPYRTFLNPNKISNQSAIYAVENLKNLVNKDELLWAFQIRALSMEGNRDKIKDFVNSYKTLDKIQGLKLYQISSLLGFCIDYSLYDTLKEIRGLFDESNKITK